MKILYTGILLLCFTWIKSQPTTSVPLFSFQFEEKGKLAVVLDTVKNQMNLKIWGSELHDLEITDDLNDTIEVFSYSYYLRGGGIENAGLDLNYLRFDYNDLHYEVYDHYSAEDDSESIGILITNKKTGVEHEYEGILKTRKGLLMHFRDSGIIPAE